MSEDAASRRIAVVVERALEARGRAARAAAVAAELEARCDRAPAAWRSRMAQLIRLHRSFEVRHLETARLHELYASRLDSWSHREVTSTALPTFIGAVASAIGPSSAAVTVGGDGSESLVAASDRTAQIACDSEFVLGEGPAHEVAAWRVPVRAEGGMLARRWPRFGSAVAEYGVGSVISLPLRQEPGGCLGALSVYDPTPAGVASVQAATIRVADALTHTVLNVPGAIADDDVPAVPMFDEADFLATVHQAAGIVSATLACKMSDAVAMLRARSFADGMPVETLARRVIDGDAQI